MPINWKAGNLLRFSLTKDSIWYISPNRLLKSVSVNRKTLNLIKGTAPENLTPFNTLLKFSRWLSGKESACSVGDVGSIPGWGRSPGGGNGNPLQYPCLGNPIHRGACQATVHRGLKESDKTEATKQ